MTTIFLVIASIVVFFVGLISPTKADSIQKKTDKIAAKLKKRSDTFYDPFTWIVQSCTEFIRKFINVSARLGQKSRHKITGKKPKNKRN